MTGKKANRPFAFLSMNTSRGQERASDKHPLSDAEEEGVRRPKAWRRDGGRLLSVGNTRSAQFPIVRRRSCERVLFAPLPFPVDLAMRKERQERPFRVMTRRSCPLRACPGT